MFGCAHAATISLLDSIPGSSLGLWGIKCGRHLKGLDVSAGNSSPEQRERERERERKKEKGGDQVPHLDPIPPGPMIKIAAG